ncbi:MAG TPA: ROK family protein [Nevskiaceae bacterium]|nr:ROK family protein [Nevskiaceae bacterium]
MTQLRIGIDLGGTKIEGIVMAPGSRIVARQRIATPKDDYTGIIAAIAQLVQQLERQVQAGPLPVGMGHPGAISPATGLLKNSNSTCLNARPLQRDLQQALGREVRMANDADCLAVSEAHDGAAAGADNVFAVILGTGVGGGIAINRGLLRGANAIAGEWGHNPLPWARPEWDEVPGPRCWCGRHGCIETWLSGTGLAADHLRVTGEKIGGEQIVQRAQAGDAACTATLARFEDRLARALAHIINILDPQVIVLGGGVSQVQRLYQHVPALWDQWVFSDRVDTQLRPPQHGDASGVRGAAWLWPEDA